MAHEALITDWKTFPNGGRADGHLFAIPDIHGRADLLEQMLHQIAEIPDSDAARTIVFLGDLIDRGLENFRTIDLALNAKNQCDRRIILPGNHEGMLLDCLDLPLETESFHFWFKCGGHSVVKELTGNGWGSPEKLRAQLRSAFPEGYLDFLRSAPGYHVSGDLLLMHAGLLPPMGSNAEEERVRFLAQPLGDAPRMHWAWIRHPFLQWKGGWDENRRQVVVHGHTVEWDEPIGSAEEVVAAVDKVDTHARINLDTGGVYHDRLVAIEAIENRYRFICIKQQGVFS